MCYKKILSPSIFQKIEPCCCKSKKPKHLKAFERGDPKNKVEKLINNVGKSGKMWENIYIFDTENRNCGTDSMQNLIGTYECKADAKGRVLLPTALQGQLAPMLAKGFVMKRAVFQPCLELYPMDEWEILMQHVGKLNRFNRKNNDFVRRFTAGVKLVAPDSSGRLLIPKDLTAFAEIKKEVVLAAAINIVEIWDKERYETAINEATADFADLAEEVMGQNDENESRD